MKWLDLGTIGFGRFITIQENLAYDIERGREEETVIFAEHDPVISIHVSHEKKNLSFLKIPFAELSQRGIPIIAVRRGGGIAVHGPGILGCYTLLKRFDLSFNLGRDLALWTQAAIQEFGIKTSFLPDGITPDIAANEKYRGLWIGNKKIAVRGIHGGKVSRFGISINVCPEPSLIKLIHPCGITDFELGSLKDDTQSDITIQELKESLKRNCYIISRA